MGKKFIQPVDISLRKVAEKKAAEIEAENPENFTEEEIRHLLHELRVHQIELEMQNEELRRAQTELEISRLRYFELYDLAPVGYCTISEKGIIQEANLKCAELLDVTKQDLIRQPFTRYILPEDQDIYYRYRKILLETSSMLICELRILHKNPNHVWVRLEAVAARDTGGTLFYRMVIIDISERKWLEEKIVTANQDLEKRISRAVQESLEKDRYIMIQSRQAAMGEMINNIAHQWKQPLTILSMMIQNHKMAFKNGILDALYIDNMVEKAMGQIHYMSQTIDDFRNFFKPNKEKTKFFIGETIRKTSGLVEHTLKRNQIELELVIKKDIEIQGFPNELGQVILSLLQNSSEVLMERKIQNPKITVSLYEENGKAVITVEDNAGGIEPDILEKIFDSFFTTKEKGTGIGLYMSRMIIEKNMAGQINAENTATGALFKIII